MLGLDFSSRQRCAPPRTEPRWSRSGAPHGSVGRVLWAAGTVATVWLLWPSPGHACGGFFCSTVPVVQSGEAIVYGLEDDGTVTMSIRLESQGMDDDFAWILPLTVAPTEVSVGTDALFDQLEIATRAYFVRGEPTEVGTCRPRPRCYARPTPSSSGGSWGGGGYLSAGCGVSAGAPDATVPSYATLDAAGPRPDVAWPTPPDAAWSTMDGGVAVLREERVGPYDTVVLGAATAVEVVSWLRDHGYDVPVGAEPRLEEYAAARHVFLAVRMSSSASMATVRPLTVRLPTSEACLPIRLTAISTIDDLPIHTYFLGRARVTPRNYSVAEPVLGSVALWQGRDSYERHADLAIDALGGHAFATVYSGATPLVPIELEDVRDLAEVTDAAQYLQRLIERGYPATDLVMREVLARHLPSQRAGFTDAQYWQCLLRAASADECGGTPLDLDPVLLAADMHASVTVPRMNAQRMIERLPVLTRLYTSMSDFEMDVDPVFVADEGLEEVSNVHVLPIESQCSDSYLLGEQPMYAVVPGSRPVVLDPGTPSSDDSFCARTDQVTLEEYERLRALSSAGDAGVPRPAPPPPRSTGCCGSCSITPPPRSVGLPLALLVIAVARRRRRARG